MEEIRRQFEQLVKLSAQDWLNFSSKLTRQSFPKKALLLGKGQTENYLSFIEKGIIRFYIPGVERDLTFNFAFDNSFVSAYDSFLAQTPSQYCVETLSDTVLWRMTYPDLQTVYSETLSGNTIGRKAGEELFLKKAQRELSLLNETAGERYLKLFTEQPRLLRQIPLKYIASYIGITPQALSRIRRRIS
jgi:CRP-like cAMP-binding protein